TPGSGQTMPRGGVNLPAAHIVFGWGLLGSEPRPALFELEPDVGGALVRSPAAGGGVQDPRPLPPTSGSPAGAAAPVLARAQVLGLLVFGQQVEQQRGR